MTSQPLLPQVRARLGLAAELEAKPVRDAEARYQAARERYGAWRDLWRAAYLGGGSEELVQAFAELFPPTPALERHLTETLSSLRGEDESAAMDAAKTLEKLARRSLSMPLEMEVGDPRLVLQVCRLLIDGALPAAAERRGGARSARGTPRGTPSPSGDRNSSVVPLLVQYLGNVVRRMSYRPSAEVFRALHAVWDSAGLDLRMDVAASMSHLDSPEKWNYIVEALEQSGGAHLAALVMDLNVAGEPPKSVVPRLSAAMLARLKKSKRPQDWVVALGRCAGPEAIEPLEKLRSKKATRTTLQNIDEAIADLRRRFAP